MTDAPPTQARPPRPERADFAQFRPIQTRWADNDVYGHANNVVYYAWFDTAVNGWLVEQGFLDPAGSAVIGVVVETSCRYFESVGFPEPLEAGLVVERLGASSVTYAIGIFRPGENRAVAQGRFVHVMVDRATQRPVPVPPAMRTGLAALDRGP
jgi:acyl-CoA thioester hydrolase